MSFDCPICLEKVSKSIKFKNCDHQVCNDCYYLLYIHRNFLCPLCRASILDLSRNPTNVNLAGLRAVISAREDEELAIVPTPLGNGLSASDDDDELAAAGGVGGNEQDLNAGRGQNAGRGRRGRGRRTREAILIENNEVYIVREDDESRGPGCDIACGLIFLLIIYLIYFNA